MHGLKYVTNARTAQEKSAWVVLLIAALVAASVFVYRQEKIAGSVTRKGGREGGGLLVVFPSPMEEQINGRGRMGSRVKLARIAFLAELGWVDFYMGEFLLKIQVNLTQNQSCHCCGGCDKDG